MPAPEVSAFGDGSHAPGATSLTVDGGGFGAFPGSVWLYENSDLTGDADELDVVSWNDIQLSIDIPGTLLNVAGTRYLFVLREDLAWSNAFSFTLESAGGGQTGVLGLAEETDTAFSFTIRKSLALGLNSETDSALAMRPVRIVPIGLVTETDSAFSMGRLKTMLIGIATEVDTAFSLVGAQAARIILQRRMALATLLHGRRGR